MRRNKRIAAGFGGALVVGMLLGLLLAPLWVSCLATALYVAVALPLILWPDAGEQ